MNTSDLVWIDENGYHYEDYPAFLQYFIEGYQAIFGADIYLGSDSKDGQMVAFQAQVAYDCAVAGAATYASLSPATAQGVGLSRVVKVNGIARQGASRSTVELILQGTPLTTIKNGIAIDKQQNQWALPSVVTIPTSGTTNPVTATAIEDGAISADANTVTGIFTPTQGWKSVNNSLPATAGVAVESDAALRSRQRQSVANPSLTVFEGTLGAIKNLPGVLAVKGYENDTSLPDTSTGLPPRSVAFVVSGGLDTEIGEAIRVRKTPGISTAGNTPVALVDSEGMPAVIKFYRPTPVPIGVQLSLVPLSSWVTGNESIIASAIAAYINGQIEIGATVVLTELYAAAYVAGSEAAGSFTIAPSCGIQICRALGGTPAATDIVLAFDEEAACDPETNVVIMLT